jgi:hypothetical protein
MVQAVRVVAFTHKALMFPPKLGTRVLKPLRLLPEGGSSGSRPPVHLRGAGKVAEIRGHQHHDVLWNPRRESFSSLAHTHFQGPLRTCTRRRRCWRRRGTSARDSAGPCAGSSSATGCMWVWRQRWECLNTCNRCAPTVTVTVGQLGRVLGALQRRGACGCGGSGGSVSTRATGALPLLLLVGGGAFREPRNEMMRGRGRLQRVLYCTGASAMLRWRGGVVEGELRGERE